MPKTLVSLGMSCQTTHQLARFTQQNPELSSFQKGPFDWLICPPGSAASWLENGLEDFAQDQLTILRDHAYWPAHKLWFWHGFFTKSDTGRTLDMQRNFARELAKLAFQRTKFAGLDPADTEFFVSNVQNNLETDVFEAQEVGEYTFTGKNISALHDALSGFFHASISLHVVCRDDRMSSDMKALTGNEVKVHVIEAGQTEWKGENDEWDKVLNAVVNAP